MIIPITFITAIFLFTIMILTSKASVSITEKDYDSAYQSSRQAAIISGVLTLITIILTGIYLWWYFSGSNKLKPSYSKLRDFY